MKRRIFTCSVLLTIFKDYFILMDSNFKTQKQIFFTGKIIALTFWPWYPVYPPLYPWPHSHDHPFSLSLSRCLCLFLSLSLSSAHKQLEYCIERRVILALHHYVCSNLTSIKVLPFSWMQICRFIKKLILFELNVHQYISIISSSELTAQVSFSDCLLSFCPSTYL